MEDLRRCLKGLNSYQMFYVYVMSNKRRTVFYTGITNDLVRHSYEHKEKLVDGFTKKYNIDQLVYFEQYDDPETAILREKQVKDYRRSKKLELIRRSNPDFKDLYAGLLS